MSGQTDRSCGCGPVPHPPYPDIPAGLTSLAARQLAGFPEYRQALLSSIPLFPALSAWRARGEGDLGVMLLEAWAYVLDVTAFYDARIAERAYIGTTPEQAGAQRLAALLGHRPRPAMATRVKLALEADGADPVLLPVGTAFRSEPFDDQPPQVFELRSETMIWPQRNRWELAPVRDETFDGTLRFLPRRGPDTGAVLVLWAGENAVAARVVSVETEIAVDGANYQRVELEGGSLASLTGEQLTDITVAILRQPLAENPFVQSTESGIKLDTVYSQVKPGQWAVTEIDGDLQAVKINEVKLGSVTIVAGTDESAPVTAPLTEVVITPALTWSSSQAFTLHANPFSLGSPTRPAQTTISLGNIEPSGALMPPVAELGDAPSGGSIILLGEKKAGALVTGTINEAGDGVASFLPDENVAPFDSSLAMPVSLFGNVAEAVRGETIVDEVLGSGNASLPFNSFELAKQPLTWVEDASLPDGRRPELTVRVDNIEWDRMDSFFGHGPEERIYLVRQDTEGVATIHFGDGIRGARVPSGVDNIRADYRYGAGAAQAPAGSVNQIARPVPGLVSVRGPLPAAGGADTESAEEIRSEAPKNALTLGRAVSVADFEALARSYPGVLNAAAGWAWDARRQRAGVKLWIITGGGDISMDLRSWLAARAAPYTTITVVNAGIASVSTMAITLEMAEKHDPVLVRDNAHVALFDPTTGLLAPANVEIGRILFRSELTHRLHQATGIASVVSTLLDSQPMPHAVNPGEGNWFDLEAGTTIL